MKYAFIRENTGTWSLRTLARLLDVHPSGYYAWLQKPEMESVAEERRLYERIFRLWRDSGCVDGYRRIYEDLRDSGEKCTLGRVRILMKSVKNDAQCTIDDPNSQADKPEEFDLVHPPLPNLRWVVGTSGITTQEGRANLAVIIDLFSGRIIRWALHDVDARDLQLQALQSLLLGRSVSQKLVVHFDSGTQYTHKEWRRALKLVDPERRISRRGPYQHQRHVAVFFEWLLTEKIDGTVFATNQELQFQLFNFVAEFNSHQRPESVLNPLLDRIPDIQYGGYDFTM